MTPNDMLMTLWPRMLALHPDVTLKLVPFENTLPATPGRLGAYRQGHRHHRGEVEALLEENGCNATDLSAEPFHIMLSLDHPLTSKDLLTVDDLAGERLQALP
ncbi:MAG: hypothetical protein SOY67_03565 [Collinsella sp.]|nr:hypothetical protein [Collinsella sp.]